MRSSSYPKPVMYHIQKHKTSTVLKWVWSNVAQNNLRPSKTNHWVSGLVKIAQNSRFYGRKADIGSKSGGKSDEMLRQGDNKFVISRAALLEAQGALIEYLHCTRSLQFVDAENIGRNAPRFLEKLLEGVGDEDNVGQSITRFLRYHPINEFEPFFESMGLKPSEYSLFLPRNLMFLSDDSNLLENYHVLCQYGIAPNKVGKIFKEAKEVFRYNDGCLLSRLQSLQEMGFDQYSVAKLVTSSPHLLIGDGVQSFSKVVKEFEYIGIVRDWIMEHLSVENTYNWNHILELLCLFNKIGVTKEQLGGFLSKHPNILFTVSGSVTTSVVGLLLKFGASADDLVSMFLQFPQMDVQNYLSNLRRSYLFLSELEMEVQDIGWLFCAHPALLGSCSLKKVKTALNCLNSGKERLCKMIMENPEILKNLVLGSKVERLPALKDSMIWRTKFLLDLGFAEDSAEMKRALKRFRGRAGLLQERFDCLVNAGLSREDVTEMMKTSPQVINQSKEVLEMKIDFLVHGLGYPLSSIVAYPSYLSYALPKVKLRFSMYNWLQDQEKISKDLALSSILACSDKIFIKEKVNRHPKGTEVWEMLRKQIYSDSM